MSQVVGVFVATEAATADVLGIALDDFVLSHLAVPIISRITRSLAPRQ
jgi:hypothetical protein